MIEPSFKVELNVVVFKTHQATRGVVNFYSAGFVTNDRWIGSFCMYLLSHCFSQYNYAMAQSYQMFQPNFSFHFLREYLYLKVQ
jgi:hypothetical protein